MSNYRKNYIYIYIYNIYIYIKYKLLYFYLLIFKKLLFVILQANIT